MTDEEFRDLISESLTCRLTDGEDCGKNTEDFLSRCFYQAVRTGARCLDFGFPATDLPKSITGLNLVPKTSLGPAS